MSTPQSIAAGAEDDSSSTDLADAKRSFRPLAPKPSKPLLVRPPLHVRPPLQRSRTAPSLKGLSRRFKSSNAPCAVCGQVGCRLPTHRAFSTGTTRSSASSSAVSLPTVGTLPRIEDTPYVHSYGFAYSRFFHASSYVDHDIAASRIDPFFDLPIQQDGNLPELNRLFHDYFTIECARAINIPRPPEIASELIHSPFFVPAMNDPALCLSVLASAAVSIPNRSGQSARTVTALTLVGLAMQALRERMTLSPEYITDSTIVAATLLWAVNSLLADPVSMKTHAESVYALVRARGGLKKLGTSGAVAGLVGWVDTLHGFITVQPCKFQDAKDPGPFTNPPVRTYGRFFETERSAALLDHRVATSCRESCRDTEILEKAVESGITPAEYVHLLSRMYYLSIQRTILNAEFDNLGSMNECFGIASALFRINVFHLVQDQRLMIMGLTARLTRALRQTSGPSFWAADLDILIWILFIAVLVPHEFDDKDWCMDLLARALRGRFGDHDWPHDWPDLVQKDLLHFLWSRIRCAEPFERVCRSLRERTMSEEEDG